MKHIKNKYRLLLTMILTACMLFSSGAKAEKKYEPTWESLKTHSVPEWLKDAKFGIYAHWGVYSVPAYGNEWYGKLMYDSKNKRNVYKHHMKKYNGPAKFSYKKFIPMFKAEKFNPEAWAEIIQRSGAKYAGIAVVHHDGFLLWDSNVSRWNAGKMGPKRDLYGELVTAFRKKGLKTIATFHHFRTFDWYLPQNPAQIKKGRKEGWDLFDPKYADLYWNKYTGKLQDFITEWKAKVREVTDKYQPDLLWFDGGKFQDLGYEKDVLSTLAYYFNKSLEWGKKVEVLNKLPTSLKFNFPDDFGALTFEEGRDRPDIVKRTWIDDQKIGEGSWGYVENMRYKKVNFILDGFIDRVSRNGGLVLSLSPMANGEIPKAQKDILLGIGTWLKINGEAIYGTRPWKIHAEGNIDKLRTRKARKKGHVKWNFNNCSSKDIRFTKKGNILYAIALDWPKSKELLIKTLGDKTRISTEGISSISLLGSKDKIKWSRDDNGLLIQMPDKRPCDHAFAFKITPKGKLADK